MKTDDIKVGGRYTAKVSGSVVPVRITGERWVGEVHKGWNAVNTATNRPVVIKSAQRLRSEIKDGADAEPAAVPEGANGAAVGAPVANGVVAVAGSPRPPKAAKAAKAPKAKPAPKPKAEKKAKAPKAKKAKKMSGLDAVAQVLAEAGKPMSAMDMTTEALKRGLWKTGGKTPHATVYAAIIRDIAARGKESRFRKTGRGMFEHVKR